MGWIDGIIEWFKNRDPLLKAGELAAAEAERLWKLDVVDPPIGAVGTKALASLAVINKILADAGWSWAGPYRGNGPPQWCGLFAASVWRAAGIDPKWLATFWASTVRLDYFFHYRPWKSETSQTSAGERTANAPRMVIELDKHSTAADVVFPDGSSPRAGDIVVVGDGNPAVGDHITICMGYKDGVFDTISGNGGGAGPHGDRREGISRRDFHVGGTTGYYVLRVYRIGVDDLKRI